MILRFLFVSLVSIAAAQAQTLTAVDVIDSTPASTGVSGFELSSDDNYLYAVSDREALLGVFQRNPGTGALTSIDTETAGLADNPEDTIIRLTPDNRFLYAGGEGSNGLAVYSRDELSGVLTLLDDNAANIDAATDIVSMAISSDNQNLYLVTRTFDDGFTFDVLVFSINSTDGSLVLLQAFTPDQPTGLLFLTPDDNFVYIPETRRQGVVLAAAYVLYGRATDGTLSVIGETAVSSAQPRTQTPRFTQFADRVFVPGLISQDPPASLIQSFSVNPATGRFGDSVLTSLFQNTGGELADNLLLLDGDRLLISNSPLTVSRIQPDTHIPLPLNNTIINNLPFTEFSRGALIASNDQQFVYVGGFDGITIFQLEGLNLPPASPVPAMSLRSAIALAILLLLGLMYYQRNHRLKH